MISVCCIMLLFVKAKSMHGKTMNLMAFRIHVLDSSIMLVFAHWLAVVTWEVGLTLNLRNCLPMCGSDPESFYPRAYDLYDPLECGPHRQMTNATQCFMNRRLVDGNGA